MEIKRTIILMPQEPIYVDTYSCNLSFNIALLSDCCRSILVHYDENSTHVYEENPNIFQKYKMQNETLNERSYYVGTSDDRIAIALDNCGEWIFQLTTRRSVK